MQYSKIKAFFYSALLLCSALLAQPTASAAVEIKASGLWQFRPFSWAQRNLQKGHGDDRLRAASRLRSEIEFIVSENLRGVLALQAGHQNWGVQSQGAALGTDGKFLSIRRSYVDWTIPDIGTRVRMGLQLLDLPSMTGIGSAVVNTNAAGVAASHQFTEQVAGTLFWTRLENDNATTPEGLDQRSFNPHDAFDYVGGFLPVKTDTFRATPWAMYGFVGRDSFKNTGIGQPLLMQGMLPLGATPALVGDSDTAQGSSWFAGIAAQWRPTAALNIALDATYGTIDVGKTKLRGRDFDVKRSGWYAALLAEYKMDFGVPGFLFWYASGDDGNAYNGSERLPALFPDMLYSSYGAGATAYGGAANTLGLGLAGSWVAMFRITNMSFYEKLSHTLRFIHYQGTNSKDMVRQGFITNPQATMANFTYMTTGDRAIEVNVDNHYKLYDNLTMSLELGYIRMQQDRTLWRSVGYEANTDNYKFTLSFNFTF